MLNEENYTPSGVRWNRKHRTSRCPQRQAESIGQVHPNRNDALEEIEEHLRLYSAFGTCLTLPKRILVDVELPGVIIAVRRSESQPQRVDTARPDSRIHASPRSHSEPTIRIMRFHAALVLEFRPASWPAAERTGGKAEPTAPLPSPRPPRRGGGCGGGGDPEWWLSRLPFPDDSSRGGGPLLP
ncbi:unnamed protein product, partial [Ectocarpus sp. 12 AP-2014]